ncbi:hypothetical protein WMY93_025999 [Mugilogobius chulae]|uniref:Pentraxin family member n=1 Tax=Mugilogobius chulae TaxID=88201 RepID=A0AAW0N685_9GOBI
MCRTTGFKMALVYILFSLILGMSTALPQDMSGKMLVFPQETNTDHVRLTTSRQDLGAVTVCMRYFTDLTRSFTLFGLATPSHNNAFHIFKMPVSHEINVDIRNFPMTFRGQDYQINKWQSLCGTWESGSGLVQLWLDGKPSAMKLGGNLHISGTILIVLGQDQDSYGGSFDKARCFTGMITDVHMWDYILSPHHIDNYSQKFNFPTGNVLDWNSIEFQTRGSVLIQKKQPTC